MPKLLFDRGPDHQPIRWSAPAFDGWSFLRRLVTLLAICALIAPLAIGLAALSGIDHRWSDILAQFTAPVLVATVILAVILAVLRLRTAFLVALPVIFILAAAVWPQWMADSGKARAGAPVVTLYSANLYYRNDDTARIRASIAAANPDVIVLIEASHVVVHRLDTVLAGYPNRMVSTNSLRGGKDDMIIASRFPMTPAPSPAPRRPYPMFNLYYQYATIQTPIGPIKVVGTHLTRPWPYQMQWDQIRQATALHSVVTELGPHTLVAGDFNSVSSARIGRLMTEAGRLKANPGWPGTWPAQLPAPLGMTIDQVYRTPDLAVVGRSVGRRTGSDHRPVITRFTLAEPRSTH